MENAFTAPEGLVSMLFGIAGVLFALRYLHGQSESPSGLTLIFSGFACVFLTKILFLTNAILSYDKQLFLDLSLNMCAAILFACGGLRFKGVKAVSKWLTGGLCLGAIVWAWNVLLVMGDGNLYVFSKIVSLIAGYGVLGASLWGKKLHNAIGFVITGWVCVFLAVYNLLINVSWGKSLFSPSFETFLYIALMCGLILISNNILGHTFHTLKKEVKENKERLRLMIQMSPFPIIISRLKDDQLMLINSKAGDLLGLDIKHPGRFKTSDCFADPSNRNDLLAKLEKNPVIDDFEILAKPRKGEPFWLLLSARVIDFEHEIALYMAFQNITERKKKELKLFDQATRDPLTKCYNRRQFDELSKKEVQRYERYHHPFCLFMIDADHFKNVNDTHGHAVGDLVLMSLADCLRRSLRETDIIARFGGEEFVVLLPETSLENAHHVTERLRIRFSKIVVKNETGGDVRFTVSTGLVSSETTSNIEEMLKLSDECLYVAKENGRNRVIVYGENGPEKDRPAPTGEDIDKVNAEDLYYFSPNSSISIAGASGAAVGGSPLEAGVEEHEETSAVELDDDDYEEPEIQGGGTLSSLYDEDNSEDTTYTPVTLSTLPETQPAESPAPEMPAMPQSDGEELYYDPYALPDDAPATETQPEEQAQDEAPEQTPDEAVYYDPYALPEDEPAAQMPEQEQPVEEAETETLEPEEVESETVEQEALEESFEQPEDEEPVAEATEEMTPEPTAEPYAETYEEEPAEEETDAESPEMYTEPALEPEVEPELPPDVPETVEVPEPYAEPVLEPEVEPELPPEMPEAVEDPEMYAEPALEPEVEPELPPDVPEAVEASETYAEPALEPEIEPELPPDVPETVEAPETYAEPALAPEVEPELPPEVPETVEAPEMYVEPALEPEVEPELPPDVPEAVEASGMYAEPALEPEVEQELPPDPVPSPVQTDFPAPAPAPAPAPHAPPHLQMPKMKLPVKMMAVKVPQMPNAMKVKLPKLPPKPPSNV